MTSYRHDALPTHHLLNNTYRIERVLGSGAFGITYLAHHIHLQSEHVIKEYIPDTATRQSNGIDVTPKGNNDEELFQYGLSSFFKEAQLLHKLSHPHVVKVTDLFEANQTAYFVMPYLGSSTLLDWINTHPNPDRAALEKIFIPLLEGLKYIHAQNLLHRDIKPANILITPEGRPILIDFGSARIAMGYRSKPLTQILTPGFAPLEQYSHNGTYTPALDLYSLSACLYQAITGKLPEEAVNRVQQDPHIPLVQQSPYHQRYPQHWLAAIDKGLNVHAIDRYQNAFEMQKALLGQTTSNTPPPPPQSNPQTTHNTTQPHNNNSGCFGTVFKLTLICTAIGIAAYGYWSSSNKKRAPENNTSSQSSNTAPYHGELRISPSGKSATFIGRIENGKANDSNGRLVFDDGTECEGSIINNKRDGEVVCNYPRGSRYIGTWKNDQKHGSGKYIMSSKSPGAYYQGGYANNNLNGEGVIEYKNGARYEGEFAHDKIRGKGSMTGMPDSPPCQGRFDQGKNFAKCSYQENGATYHYEGGFKNALWEGKGKLITMENGEETNRLEGIFKQGKFVQESKRPAPPPEQVETIETEEEKAASSASSNN